MADPICGTQQSPGPRTCEEARWFHQGLLSGLTIYAREMGHSTLKSQNALLRRLMDDAGERVIGLIAAIGDDGEQPAQVQEGNTDG